MRITVATLVMGVVLTGCLHQPPELIHLVGIPTTTRWIVWSTVMGKDFTFEVTSEDVANTPDWPDPSFSPPPLSVDEAIKISRGELSRYLPIDAEWDLKEVTLIQLGSPGKWFYRIEWRPRVHYQGDNLGIPVLMSGKAVVGKEGR